jgi:hypothetical protein
MNRLRTVGTAILERHGFFSIDQIMGSTKFIRKYCRDVLMLFCQEGLIRQIKKGRKEHVFGKPPTYAMIYCVIDRKRVAARIAPRRFENTVEAKLWFIIWNKFKNNGSFNLHDLIVLAGAKKGTARSYIKTLRRAGYILPSRKAGPGVEWGLTGKFGPERPYLDHSRRIKKRRKNTARFKPDI